MTITVQPWTRIADLRVEFKYSKLLKRLVNAFNAVKIEQTHWNRVCTMIGNAAALLTEDALNRCALQLGWQPTWMTETQNNTRRTIVPATEYGAIRAFVRPVNNNSEAVGIPLPAFRGSFETEEEGMASNPPARIRRRTIPPRAIIHANQAANVNSEVNPAADPAVVNPPVSAPVDPAVVNPPAPVELVAEPVPAHPEVPEAAAAEVPEAEAPPVLKCHQVLKELLLMLQQKKYQQLRKLKHHRLFRRNFSHEGQMWNCVHFVSAQMFLMKSTGRWSK